MKKKKKNVSFFFDPPYPGDSMIFLSSHAYFSNKRCEWCGLTKSSPAPCTKSAGTTEHAATQSMGLSSRMSAPSARFLIELRTFRSAIVTARCGGRKLTENWKKEEGERERECVCVWVCVCVWRIGQNAKHFQLKGILKYLTSWPTNSWQSTGKCEYAESSIKPLMGKVRFKISSICESLRGFFAVLSCNCARFACSASPT